MWQSLQDEFKDQGFTVLAVALDEPQAARPWVDAAKPSYPCVIDRGHLVADLYHLVNVPQAVWIDEQGRIVRPPHTAGSTDGFRAMDRKTFTIADEVLAERNRVKAAYFDAVRDWARHGAASRHAWSAERVMQAFSLPDDGISLAHAHFRLGQQLLAQGQVEEAQAQMARASALHPDSWAIWRQAAAKDARGLAAGPEFWARVDALGSRPYYAPVEVDAPPA